MFNAIEFTFDEACDLKVEALEVLYALIEADYLEFTD